MIGQAIGPYQVLSKLGEGGMGAVYRARDTDLQRDVAIKVLLPDVVGDQEQQARLSREAQHLASLNHPNIAGIYGMVAAGGTKALILELVEGPTLADRIAQGPMPLNEAIEVARQIADALDAAHSQGIVHRDLKPANIKLNGAWGPTSLHSPDPLKARPHLPDGSLLPTHSASGVTVKVLDFGLAKAMVSSGASGPARPASSPEDSPTVTSPAPPSTRGMVLGTPAYMSPEQASGKPVDRRADIWAFGVVLFEMVTGRRLFEGETISHVLAAVLRDEPDLAAAPPELRLLLARCLQKDPRKRLRDIGDAMGLVGHAPAARQAQPIVSRWPAFAGWSAAGVLAVALAAVGWSTRHSPDVASGDESPVVRFQIERSAPNSAATSATAFAVSPNGQFLAHYGSGVGGRILLSVRTLATGETREIPDSIAHSQTQPFWSTDSRYVVYPTTRALQVFDVTTGTVQDLCACRFQGGSWNSEGVIVLGGFRPGEPIQRLSLDDRTLRPAVSAQTPAGARDQWPVFLPDGQRFLFTRTTASEPAATYAASLAGGAPTRVATGSRRMFFTAPGTGNPWLLGIESGGLVAQVFDAAVVKAAGDPIVVVPGAVAASVSENGVLVTSPAGGGAIKRPTWFDRQGKPLGYMGDSGPMYAASLSPDGSSAVVQQPSGRPGEGGAAFLRTSTGGNRRLPDNQGAATVWSPDGSRLLNSNFRDGRVNLYLAAADGSGGETRLFPSTSDVHANDWSRDGKWVIYTARKDEGFELDLDLWVFPMDGRADAKPAPYLTGTAREAQAEFSPDGRFVAYTSTEIGAPAVYVQPFPDASAGKWLVSTDGGVEPHWNPNGTELFYFSGTSLMAVPVRTAPTFSLGTPVRLFDADVTPWYVNDSDRTQVADNGRRFLLLVNTEKNVVPPLDVVVNWPRLLDRPGRR